MTTVTGETVPTGGAVTVTARVWARLVRGAVSVQVTVTVRAPAVLKVWVAVSLRLLLTGWTTAAEPSPKFQA